MLSRPSNHGREYFLNQRPDTGLLAGLWDFPNIAFDDPELEETEVQEVLTEYLVSLGFSGLHNFVRKGSSLHIFTHIRRTSQVYAVEVMDQRIDLEGKWVTEDEIAEMAVSELGRKVFRLALGLGKKRNSSAEEGNVKLKPRKAVKLEKGQQTLAFVMSRKSGEMGDEK